MKRVSANLVPAVLAHIGATNIREVRDAAGALVGYDIEPSDISLSGYAAADAAYRKAGLLAYARDRRWQREVAGVTVTIGGEVVPVSTNRGADRSALHMTYSAIKGGLRADGAVFNFADGRPRKVANADMETAILSALAHVQAAFDLGEQVFSAIEAGEITTQAEIDAEFAA